MELPILKLIVEKTLKESRIKHRLFRFLWSGKKEFRILKNLIRFDLFLLLLAFLSPLFVEGLYPLLSLVFLVIFDRLSMGFYKRDFASLYEYMGELTNIKKLSIQDQTFIKFKHCMQDKLNLSIEESQDLIDWVELENSVIGYRILPSVFKGMTILTPPLIAFFIDREFYNNGVVVFSLLIVITVIVLLISFFSTAINVRFSNNNDLLYYLRRYKIALSYEKQGREMSL